MPNSYLRRSADFDSKGRICSMDIHCFYPHAVVAFYPI